MSAADCQIGVACGPGSTTSGQRDTGSRLAGRRSTVDPVVGFPTVPRETLGWTQMVSSLDLPPSTAPPPAQALDAQSLMSTSSTSLRSPPKRRLFHVKRGPLSIRHHRDPRPRCRQSEGRGGKDHHLGQSRGCVGAWRSAGAAHRPGPARQRLDRARDRPSAGDAGHVRGADRRRAASQTTSSSRPRPPVSRSCRPPSTSPARRSSWFPLVARENRLSERLGRLPHATIRSTTSSSTVPRRWDCSPSTHWSPPGRS